MPQIQRALGKCHTEGEKLYSHVSVAFEHILAGEQEIARDRGLETGTVTIASSEIALHCVLLPVLKNYRKLYPGIKIKISNHSTPQALKTLKEGLADFAIVTEPFDLPANISAIFALLEPTCPPRLTFNRRPCGAAAHSEIQG